MYDLQRTELFTSPLERSLPDLRICGTAYLESRISHTLDAAGIRVHWKKKTPELALLLCRAA